MSVALRRDERGFTLIELLVVVIIIGILAAVAIPVFLRQKDKGHNAAARSDTRNMATAQYAWAADNLGEFTLVLTDLESAGFRRSDDTLMEHGICLLAGSGARRDFVVGARWEGNTIFTFDSSEGGVVRAHPDAVDVADALEREHGDCNASDPDVIRVY